MGVINIPVRLSAMPTDGDVLRPDYPGLRHQRLVVTPEGKEGLLYTEWEDAESAKRFADELTQRGGGDDFEVAAEPQLYRNPEALAEGEAKTFERDPKFRR